MESSASAFFRANAGNLATLATTPDARWKDRTTYEQEAPMHFFQWDRYQPSPIGPTIAQYVYSRVVAAVGGDFVKTNGASVWRVDQIYGLMVTALKARDWRRTLQLAGVLGHYVGDLAQPMHDSSDYDGQSIGRRGIHQYFESKLVDATDATSLRADVIAAGGQIRQDLDKQYEGSEAVSQLVRTIVVNEATEAFDQLAPLLTHFHASGQDDDELREFLPPRIGAGAATVAKIWDLAVVEARVTGIPPQMIAVEQPDWFALDTSVGLGHSRRLPAVEALRRGYASRSF